jgi:hypothetical protein
MVASPPTVRSPVAPRATVAPRAHIDINIPHVSGAHWAAAGQEAADEAARIALLRESSCEQQRGCWNASPPTSPTPSRKPPSAASQAAAERRREKAFSSHVSRLDTNRFAAPPHPRNFDAGEPGPTHRKWEEHEGADEAPAAVAAVAARPTSAARHRGGPPCNIAAPVLAAPPMPPPTCSPDARTFISPTPTAAPHEALLAMCAPGSAGLATAPPHGASCCACLAPSHGVSLEESYATATRLDST